MAGAEEVIYSFTKMIRMGESNKEMLMYLIFMNVMSVLKLVLQRMDMLFLRIQKMLIMLSSKVCISVPFILEQSIR